MSFQLKIRIQNNKLDKREPFNLNELRADDDDLSDLITIQGDSFKLPPTAGNLLQKLRIHCNAVNPQVPVGIMSGALTKEGHIRQNWKLRWFVLDSTNLSYYESHLVIF